MNNNLNAILELSYQAQINCHSRELEKMEDRDLTASQILRRESLRYWVKKREEQLKSITIQN